MPGSAVGQETLLSKTMVFGMNKKHLATHSEHPQSDKQSETSTRFNKKVLMHDLGELGFIPAPLAGTAPWLRGKEYKVGVLTKQGGIIKTWHERCFVLREQGLYYFQSRAEYHREAPPFGQILFDDVVCPMRDNPVSEVPTQLLGKRIRHLFGFCVYTAMRTYVLAAENPAYKDEWMKEIRHAYKQWMNSQDQESGSLDGSNSRLTRGDSFTSMVERPLTQHNQHRGRSSRKDGESLDASAADHGKSNRDTARKPRVPRQHMLSKNLDSNGMPAVRDEAEHKRFVRDLREDFESEVLELRKKYELQMLWCRWRAYAKLRARKKQDSLTIM
jgi:hypothetical protein